ncbi:Long chain acyl-CoA synthetase 2 [Sesbania bispinosa]|nr:Long chain acyl-CoA synthetase 2 [Sesbania bispinosa]
MPEVYTVKVEEGKPATDGKPSVGPVYWCIYAKDGLLENSVLEKSIRRLSKSMIF